MRKHSDNTIRNIKDDRKREIDQTMSLICKDEGEIGMRLDSFLAAKIHDRTRSYFQKLVENEYITVNQRPCSKHYKMKINDIVDITIPLPKKPNLEPQKMDFEIIDTQPDFLVINKPVGLTVHRSETALDEPTLINGLLYAFKEFKDFKNQDRPGIVHRLDKNTSGLLLVARNEIALSKLPPLFKERKIDKTYLAVIKGHPEPEGKIDLPIGRHTKDRIKMSHVSYAPRDALTYYKVLAYYKDCSLVSVKLVTGRTHQIRVHFAAIGHGLLGDPVYGVKSNLINRQALHSWKLAFTYKNKNYDYFCPIPQDLVKLLNKLKETKINV